ncbi:MAG TPA: hypothetical protein VHZ49_23275 [Methylomirabilota bacterium]|jgi:hypothetical protein|nr:hypothetical protein [Methylomirabilota bacterium]
MDSAKRPGPESETTVRYFFVVARRSPEILARVQERLHGDPRIDVIADRRVVERRRWTAPRLPERRTGDRRRPTNVWNDLTIYPTLVAQRHVASYDELERTAARAAGEAQALSVDNERLRATLADLERLLEAQVTEDGQLRAENTRLQQDILELQRRLTAALAADAEFRADVAALLGQAEQALGGLIAAFRRFSADGVHGQKEPHLRSL